LDYVIADVGQVFAEAQLYVALSRASDESGLELRNFSTNRVRVNPLALHFHEYPTRQVPFWWQGSGGGTMPKIMATSLTGAGSRSSWERKGTTQPVTKRKMEDVDQILQLKKQDDVPRRKKSTTNAVRATASATAGDRHETPSAQLLDDRSLREMTVVELKQMLRERGLKVSGTKSELINRLINT
jgi:hypothetical protein